MKENNNISAFDSVFRQQLENAGATPPPGVWEGISSSIATSATTSVATTAIVKTAVWIKIGIGVVAATAVTAVVYLAAVKEDAPAQQARTVQQEIAPMQQDASAVVPMDDQRAESSNASVVNTEPRHKATVPVTPNNNEGVESPEVNHQDVPVTAEPESVIKQDEQTRPIEIPKPVLKDTKKSEVQVPQPEKLIKKKDSIVKYEAPIIPNVFTSNGDGFNDTYLIDIKGEERVRIMIFDINMNKVFETDNKTLGWNAVKPNGEEYPAGTYIVKVIYKFPGSEEKVKTDAIRLIR